jgi:hypothetical protein
MLVRQEVHQSAWLRVGLTLALAAAVIAAFLVRLVAIAEPLGIDQSLWASAVRGMARGQLLYQDVWEQRPPGIYWIYLTGFRVFGWTHSSVAWLDILASLCTAGLVFAIAHRLAGLVPGLLAASLYSVLTMPSWLFRYGGFLERSVCETFIVVCVGAAFWCAVRYRDRPSRWLIAGAGFFAGAAVVLKPNAGVYFFAVLAWTALYWRGARPLDRRTALEWMVLAGAGAAIMPVAALVWLWQYGLLQEAWTAVILFNRFYVSEGLTAGGYALGFSKAVWLRMKTDPLWLAGGVGAVAAVVQLARTRRLPPLAGLAVVWGAASVLAIVVNGARLFNSYFIQAFAPLALLSAWLLTGAVRGTRLRQAIGLATLAGMLFLLVDRNYATRVLESARADLDVLYGRTDRASYLDRFGGYGNRRGYSARANQELADYVRGRTGPGDRIFLIGINGAGVYFAADRLPAHRFLRVNFFVETEFPDPRFRLEAVVKDLAERRPTYIIFERLNSTSDMGRATDALQEHPLIVQLLQAYRRDAQIEDFTLYRLIE